MFLSRLVAVVVGAGVTITAIVPEEEEVLTTRLKKLDQPFPPGGTTQAGISPSQ